MSTHRTPSLRWAPLHLAGMNGHFAAVIALLDHGDVDPNAADEEEWTLAFSVFREKPSKLTLPKDRPVFPPG